jgi:hypothetical protein
MQIYQVCGILKLSILSNYSELRKNYKNIQKKADGFLLNILRHCTFMISLSFRAVDAACATRVNEYSTSVILCAKAFLLCELTLRFFTVEDDKALTF